MKYTNGEYKKQKIEAYKDMASAIADTIGLDLNEMPIVYEMIEVYMKNKKELDVNPAVFPVMRMKVSAKECVDLLRRTVPLSELEEEINKVTKVLPPRLANV